MNATTHIAYAAAQRHPLSWLQQLLVSGSRKQAVAPAHKVHVLLDGDTIEITQPLRYQLVCSQGTLWITHDGCPADHIVEQGQRYQAASGSRMLMHALGDASVRVARTPA